MVSFCVSFILSCVYDMYRYSLNDFDYTLPDAFIAQFPTKNRSDSRLLIVPPNQSEHCVHTHFSSILRYAHPGDLLIFNDTKVIPARLHGQKETGGKVSCLIERVIDDRMALAHIGASHPPKIGAIIQFDNAFSATVMGRENELFVLRFSADMSLIELLLQHGHLPLPPYITRSVKREDWDRYQTVYAKHLGAVAAPTAGLHFDGMILSQLKLNLIEFGFLTLHVGAGTFQPVRTENLDKHHMHSEMIHVTQTVCDQIQACKQRGGRVIAVGTTVVRALESAAMSGKIAPFQGETSLFITPGFRFQVVDRLLTNFHLPKSTLLMLVCAFAGYERVMSAYREAVAQHYRFFSYGDVMLLRNSR